MDSDYEDIFETKSCTCIIMSNFHSSVCNIVFNLSHIYANIFHKLLLNSIYYNYYYTIIYTRTLQMVGGKILRQ